MISPTQMSFDSDRFLIMLTELNYSTCIISHTSAFSYSWSGHNVYQLYPIFHCKLFTYVSPIDHFANICSFKFNPSHTARETKRLTRAIRAFNITSSLSWHSFFLSYNSSALSFSPVEFSQHITRLENTTGNVSIGMSLTLKTLQLMFPTGCYTTSLLLSLSLQKLSF